MSVRLDVAVSEKLCLSRAKAADLIKSGLVRVDGIPARKPSAPFDANSFITIVEHREFVSRGGHKLFSAIEAFKIDLTNAICLDIGASTGGFTDCMLQCGAESVLSVDNGHGQLASSLLADPRVTSLEGINIIEMAASDMPPGLSFAACDVSFVSLKKLMPFIAALLPQGCLLVFLVKPQFELTRADIGKNGIVRDEKARQRAARTVQESMLRCGISPLNMISSPITGGDGNIEYLIYGKVNEISDK